MCEERSNELKEFPEERRHGMLFILSLGSSLVMFDHEGGIMLWRNSWVTSLQPHLSRLGC